MSYNPFSRGPNPVGVRTMDLSDSSRIGRQIQVEYWYPADAAHLGAAGRRSDLIRWIADHGSHSWQLRAGARTALSRRRNSRHR